MRRALASITSLPKREETVMAGVDVGGGGGKRAVNQEINMIPFIDLLMVTVAFLLITAVWVSYQRLNANAQIPGNNEGPIEPDTVEKTLHLQVEPHEFVLSWRQASTVVSETRMARPPSREGQALSYDDLADKIGDEWKLHGGHTNASDKRQDRCVLHADNGVPFRELVAVMDALYQARRDMVIDGQKTKVPVFNMAFAAR
jgi:biopolymer transport protein ExbD